MRLQYFLMKSELNQTFRKYFSINYIWDKNEFQWSNNFKKNNLLWID